VQFLAPQASLAAGQGPALALAGNALDGSSGPWRKEAGGATAAGAAGQAATPAAKPQAQFTVLLDSLVEAGNAPAVKKDDGSRAAFWVAVATATPQVSHPVKPADGAAETEDGARTNDSPTAERAAAPETSGDAAAALVKVAPQSGAPLPIAIATLGNRLPEAPKDRAEAPEAAAPAMENGAPDSKLAAVAAEAEQATAGGTAAGAEAKFRQTAGDRPAAGGTQDRNETAAKQETTGEAAAVSQPARPVTQAGAEAKSRQTASAPPASGHTQDGKRNASQQETVAANSDSLQVLSTARMTPAQTQLPAAGLPAAERPAAGPVLEADGPPRPWREGRSPCQGATGKNGATKAGTVSGQPLAAPAVAEQTPTVSQPDSNEAQSGGARETAAAAGQPAANSAPAALQPQDGAMQSGAARPMVVAFTARLRPVEAAPEAPGGELPNRVAEPTEAAPVSDTAAATGEMGRAERENSHDTPAASTRQPDVSREPARKPAVSAAAAAPEPAGTAHPAATPQPLAANGERPRESAPASPPPAATAEPAAAPVAPKPAAAHDIKLELAGQGDRRVEVRVSERAGDMHVEVRTPDAGLAGDLREELPALATKLEQTGFRAETWHPAGTAERQRTAEAAPGAASQNSERQPGEDGGQRQQRDPQQQPKPKGRENQTPSQNAGKDFAWLFSSIQ
jgi:hypothetical protein